MEVDITKLLILFDDLDPNTDEARGIYWFKGHCDEGVTVSFVISIYEPSVSIRVYKDPERTMAYYCFKNFSEINVLDEQKKCLEIISKDGKGRCFLSLLGDRIVDYTE